ncbi:putative membrane protein [Primorskyibacter sedentarius]|uniref:Putative membrane protein n=2 Tax=Primorskyibacter sedentarius TaxID=745311 RepID=A0A4R3JLS5_9RHOB|nr:putative membrane protein [Primorskyibacter sedentarius]
MVASMTWSEILSVFSPLDFAAVALLFVAWVAIGLVIEYPPASRPSVSALMAEYRREWMRQFVTRDPRIFDAQIVSNLRQGTAFFASASMIAVGGGLALVGNSEQLTGIAEDLIQTNEPDVFWEIKLVVMLLFAANAFLKFVWSHRLFGYCSVLMAATPNDPSDPRAYPAAAKAAEINITAARGYNRGLRSVYFGIGASAWLLGALPLILAVIATLIIVGRREFASDSRIVLLDNPALEGHTQT